MEVITLEKYIGKTCPYCKTTLTETDDIVVCDICEMPHHKDCWIENGSCTTFGCTGKVKNLSPFAQNPFPYGNNNIPSQPPFVPPVAPIPPIPPQQPYSAPMPQAGQPFMPQQPPQQFAPQQPQRNFAFCTKCGNRYMVGNMFCQQCGNRLPSAQAPAAAPVVTKEEQDKKQYEQALKLLEANRFDDALKIFVKLGTYSDSQEKANECVTAKDNARKERIYVASIAILNVAKATEAELKKSIQSLKTIEDYKDSKEKIQALENHLEKWYEAKKAAEEEARKKQYDTAIAKLNAKAYAEAIVLFNSLGEYMDSKAYLKKCLDAKEALRIEGLYKSSVAVLDLENPNEFELKSAIENLKSIADYEDAKDKIAELEELLEQWYADKAAAEEAERERQEEIRKKKKRIAIIISVAVLLVALIISGIIFVTRRYTITYNVSGGVLAKENKTSYTLITKDITLVNPAKEGYTFVGWTGSGLVTPTPTVTIKMWSMGNKTYVANWKANTYNITFDPDGGVLETTTVSIDYNTALVLPTPTRVGYTFDGWFSDTNRFNNGKWTYTTDVTLKAKWTPIEYSLTLKDIAIGSADALVVTLNPNYSGATLTTVVLPNNQKFSYPENPIRNGYVFTGWYTDSACSNKYTFKGNISDNMTLYAGWKELTVKNDSTYLWNVTSNSLTSTNKDDGTTSTYRITAPAPATVTFEYKTSSETSDYLYIRKNGSTHVTLSGTSTTATPYSVTLAANDYIEFVYVKDDSRSEGEDCAYISNLKIESSEKLTSTATAKYASTVSYGYSNGRNYIKKYKFDSSFTLPVPTRRGYAFLGWYKGNTKVESGTWTTAANMILTPKWEAGGNTLVFDANGGTVSAESMPVIYDKEYTLPIPTREGYTFDGWFDANDIKYQDGIWDELADVTLVAKWTPETYEIRLDDIKENDVTVTFNYNYSGAPTSSTVTLTNGQVLNYPSTPTRSGYVFSGWYTNSGCTTRYNFTGGISSDLTLYAGWIKMNSDAVYSEIQLDPSKYNSSSNAYSISTSSTASTAKKYIYLVAQESGTHYIYWKNSSSSSYYGYYLQIKNLTTGTVIRNSSNTYSTSYNSVNFSCNKGDVIVISFYRYNTSYSSTAYFYFSGFTSATSTASANVSGYEYSDSSFSDHLEVTYGEPFTLPTPTRPDYRFVGWYNGDEKVESGIWTYTTTLTLTPKWEAIVYYNVTFANAQKVLPRKVTYNYNYSGSTSTTVTLNNGDVLSYPTVPTRSGYAFAGWYTDSACTNLYNFSGNITSDLTLYAKWFEMASSYNSRVYIDIANYNSSTKTKTFTDGSSSTSKNYYYFTVYKSGTYTFYTNYSSGDYYLEVNNSTQETTILSKTNFYGSGTKTKSVSFTANAGDIICVSTYKFTSGSSDGSGTFYVLGINHPTSTAKAVCEETGTLKYNSSSSSTVTLRAGYGEPFELPTITREGYTFLGWYNGDTKVTSGTWKIASNVTLTPKWE